MRIAYFSPLNPQKSGISDYSEELLPYLARHVDLDLFVDGYRPSNPEINRNFAVYDYLLFEDMWWRGKYDIALYQMGNSPTHEYIYRTLQQYPGVTVLHDHTLHHLVIAATVDRGNRQGYVREMTYGYGDRGLQAALGALDHGRVFPVWDFPLNRRVVDSSLGMVVHSEYCAGLVQETNPLVPLATIPHGMDIPSGPPCTKEMLGLDPSSFVVASFGLVTPAKRIDNVIFAFKELLTRVPNAIYLIVGQIPESYDIGDLIEELGLGSRVRPLGFVQKADLQRYIEAADVCVNLRYPTAGETSGIVLRAMACAKPVLVSSVGSFSELPDDACLKIQPDRSEVKALTQHLHQLATDEISRRDLSQRAVHYIRTRQDREKIAQEYVSFLQSVLSSSSAVRNTRDIGESEPRVIELVREIRASARAGASSAELSAETLPDGSTADGAAEIIRLAEAAAGDLSVPVQLQPGRSAGDRLRVALKRPFHSFFKHYLDLAALRQSEFNTGVVAALSEIERAARSDDPPTPTRDQADLEARLRSLQERATRLERRVARLRGAQ